MKLTLVSLAFALAFAVGLPASMEARQVVSSARGAQLTLAGPVAGGDATPDSLSGEESAIGAGCVRPGSPCLGR